MSEKENLDKLVENIVNLDFDGAVKAVKESLKAGIPAYSVITKGVARGMEIVGEKYEKHEYFLSELVMAGEIVKAVVVILEPYLKTEEKKARGTVVIGTVRGDLHDIGKNIVAAMLTGSGFKIYDLGVDTPPERFASKAGEVGADIVALSALLTTTRLEMKTVIEALKSVGMRERVRVLIGGRSVTPDFAKEIGADAYARDAMEAVKIAKKLVGKTG